MKTVKEILQNMISDVIASSGKVTYFGKDGIVRGMLHAVSNVLGEIWNDLYQLKRKIFPETSVGADLDLIATRKGLQRRGESKSSVILLFNGPLGTSIPLGTIVKSALSGIEYKTLSAITLGDMNLGVLRPIKEYSIGDAVLAESLDAGEKSRVEAKELTQLAAPITDVTVTNHFVSSGGHDAESDELLRYRVMVQISILNQGTQLFYETLARDFEDTILIAKAFYNSVKMSTDIYLIKNSFADYSQEELNSIADDVYSNQRALSLVNCFNATTKSVEISFNYKRDSSITQEIIFASIANSLASLVKDNFGFTITIKYQDVLNIVIDTEGVELEIPTLLLSGKKEDLICGDKEVPRLVSLSINDGVIKTEAIEQIFLRIDQ